MTAEEKCVFIVDEKEKLNNYITDEGCGLKILRKLQHKKNT